MVQYRRHQEGWRSVATAALLRAAQGHAEHQDIPGSSSSAIGQSKRGGGSAQVGLIGSILAELPQADKVKLNTGATLLELLDLQVSVNGS